MPEFFTQTGSFHVLGKNGSMMYYIHEADESSDPRYYGYVDHRGAWIIMEQTVATGVHRYANGKQDFPTNWTGKAGLSYDYYNNLT